MTTDTRKMNVEGGKNSPQLKIIRRKKRTTAEAIPFLSQYGVRTSELSGWRLPVANADRDGQCFPSLAGLAGS